MADSLPPYRNVDSAPVIYFDVVGGFGVMAGAVHIEIAGRTLTPNAHTNEVAVEFATTGRLRCSPAAAANLIEALNGALNMLQVGQQQPAVSIGRLN